MHERVEAFYAPRAGEGNQILQVKSSKSVEAICGHSKHAMRYVFARAGNLPSSTLLALACLPQIFP